MNTDDYEAIIQWHPEIVLISKTPLTWAGFLSVSCRFNSGRSIKIKIKLIVPNYPSLCNANIHFGKEITLIRNADFAEKVNDLMQNTTKVSLFLRQLQTLVSNFIDNSQIEDTTYDITNDTVKDTLKELKEVLTTPSHVQLSSDRSLNTIKMTFKNVSLKLQRKKYGNHPWTVAYSDLPEISALGPFNKYLSSLSIARTKFKLQVEMLEDTWSNLRQIDKYCCVVDPLQPKLCHLYRRIYLTSSLSIYVKINPLNPIDLPEIKFMGSEIEVEQKKDVVSKNLHNWNPKYDIVNNLMMLLDIERFPIKEEEENIKDENAVVADEECCICFSLELENETLPDKVCSNEKCRRHFHTSCLLQWLQAVAGNHVVFDHIHGSCPHCHESISCYIK